MNGAAGGEAVPDSGGERKYELIGEPNSIGLRRIRALRRVRDGVEAGTVGGWVESEANLSHDGDAWVSDAAFVSGAARVFGDALVSGAAWVFGDAWVSGDARVDGDARVSGGGTA